MKFARMRNVFRLLFVFAVGICTVLGMKRGMKSPESSVTKRHKTFLLQVDVDVDRCPDVASLLGSYDGIRIASLKEVFDSPEDGVSECSYEEDEGSETIAREKLKQEDERSEMIAEKELEHMRVFSILAQKMCDLSVDDYGGLIELARELMKDYEECGKDGEEVVSFVKKNSDFYFCCGFVAYYLCEAKDVEDIRVWFEKFFGKAMTRKNGLDLIKKAPGESAYFFMELVGSSDDDKM